MRPIAVLLASAMIFVAYPAGWAVAHSSPIPKTEAEMNAMYPLEPKFEDWEVTAAKVLAEKGTVLLKASLRDYISARFRDVHADLLADWKSDDRMFFICGEVNAKNGFGGYTGWRHFVVARDSSKRGMPSLYIEGQEAGGIGTGALMYQTYCTRGRQDRHIQDRSANYTAIISGKQFAAGPNY